MTVGFRQRSCQRILQSAGRGYTGLLTNDVLMKAAGGNPSGRGLTPYGPITAT